MVKFREEYGERREKDKEKWNRILNREIKEIKKKNNKV